jgi:hypothetical protein
MEFSWPAWLGAFAGTILAAAICVPLMRAVERCMRAKSPVKLGQRDAFEDRLSIIRRFILGAGIAILATLGYLLGLAVGGKWAG